MTPTNIIRIGDRIGSRAIVTAFAIRDGRVALVVRAEGVPWAVVVKAA